MEIKTDIYKLEELIKLLGNRRAVEKAILEEKIYKLERGYYCSTDIAPDAKAYFLLVAKYYPGAIISKMSALLHHNIGEHMTEHVDIDVPFNSNLRSSRFVKIHRTVRFSIGDTEILDIHGRKVLIYSKERTFFEVLHFDPKSRGSYASYACRRYIDSYKIDYNKMPALASDFGEKGYNLFNILHVLGEYRSIY